MPLLQDNNTNNKSAVELLASMTDTYFWLRWATGVIAVAFPIVLWIGGKIVHGLDLQRSMSAYYFTDMRDWFVGILFAIGAALYFYEGLTSLENHFMTAAALFAAGTAINPMGWFPTWWPSFLVKLGFTPHGISAISFFVMIIFSCWFCHSDILKLKLVPQGAAALRRKYLFLSALLLIAPAAAVVLNIRDGKPGESTVFYVEAFSIWSFAAYWFIKTGELVDALEATKEHARAESPNTMRNSAP